MFCRGYPPDFAMDIQKPVAATVFVAFTAYSLNACYGGKLFIEAPPGTVLTAVTASSSVSPAVNRMFYNATTDELIEAPAPEPIRVIQS